MQCLVSGFATAVGRGTPSVDLNAVGYAVTLWFKVASKAIACGSELSGRAEIVISTLLV